MVNTGIPIDNSLDLAVGTASHHKNRKISVQDKRQLPIPRLTHESNAIQQSGISALRGLKDCYGIKSGEV
jgi:hypothetical protein